MVSGVVRVSKTLHEDSKNHENQGSDISYTSPLNKIMKILFYQLFMPNKKAFLQLLSRRPLNATFNTPFLARFSHLTPPSI